MATTLERKQRPLPDIQKKTLPPGFLWGHIAGMVVFAVGIVIFTIMSIALVFAKVDEAATEKVDLPNYDYTIWRSVVVQHNARLKPFETAAQEVCREIHGRNKVLSLDPVAVVLSWMLEGHPKAVDRHSRWDDKKFILCEHEEVRKLIFLLNKDGSLKPDTLTHDQIHGKYMSPNDLRAFVATFTLLKQTKFGLLREKTSHIENELIQVEMRLNLYEALRYPGGSGEAKNQKIKDPFAFVALDKVPGSPWFSIGQLRQINQDPKAWDKQMKERVKDAPQLYLSQEHKAALDGFEKMLLANDGKKAAEQLKPILAEQREKEVAAYLDLRKEKKDEKAIEYLNLMVASWPEFTKAARKPDDDTLKDLVSGVKEKDSDAEQVGQALGKFLEGRDHARIGYLEEQLPPRSAHYDPAKPEFRMLHMTYLELRFPKFYSEMQWQEPPLAAIKKVLDSYDSLCIAYDTNDAGKFAAASEAFLNTVKEVSEKETGAVYPGDDTVLSRLGHLVSGQSIEPPGPQLINLELTFNSVRPFMWAWILMLGSLTMFCLSLGLDNRLCYRAGFGLYAVALAFQFFGFFTRIVVSGRPPVTNMYETVIWVSFMTGIFALILEGVYRRKVIALAGAFVATLGLVLADQLPLALDPKITSLVPVLRSNFWLTIHVLTIVSSYAGGALAWALGNIALILIVFGRTNRETIKMLSNFTYRALQIAVLLLAAGTFLGGWWAAYSWGRFWGWDPKETGALIALVAYVIPLHMRFIGWIKDFGLAVSAIVCFAFVLFSWYGINFIVPAGLHAYGQGAGGATWVYLAGCLNLEWVLVASLIYKRKQLHMQPLTMPNPS